MMLMSAPVAMEKLSLPASSPGSDMPVPPPPRDQVTVRTSTMVPAHSMAGPFLPACPIGANMTDSRRIVATLQVRHKAGRLELDPEAAPDWLTPNVASDWLSLIQSAHDRHEQNCEVFRDGRGLIFLRTLRPVRPDEELFMWYSDEFGRESGIPILTPENIRGNQEYACTRCPRSFVHPNCLKAHIRFSCSRPQAPHKTRLISSPPERLGASSAQASAAADLRMTLPSTSHNVDSRSRSPDCIVGASSAFRPPVHSKVKSPQALDMSPPPSRGNKPVSSPTITTSREHIERHKMFGMASGSEVPAPLLAGAHPAMLYGQSYNPLSLAMEHAALRYYYPFYGRMSPNGQPCMTDRNQSVILSQTAAHPPLHPALYYPYGFPKPAVRSETPEMMSAQMRTGAAESQSLPSHGVMGFPIPSEKEGEPLDLLPRSLYMSKSRKGHLCIYCGKLYSRKYGLKIHLRTHTGYKPLQCKVCLRPFGDPSNLNKHIRLHAEGETPYRCEHCGKVLVRRRDLERHIKSRHPNEIMKTSSGGDDQTNGHVDISDESDPMDDSGRESSNGDPESDLDEIEVVS